MLKRSSPDDPRASFCGTDLGCFIDATRSGRLAVVDYTMSLDFFGLLVSNTDKLAIEDKDGDNLLFSIRTIAATANMSDEMLKTARSKGTSDEQIQEALKKPREAQAARIGTGKRCRFPKEALASMLERWQKGHYSTSDWTPAVECKEHSQVMGFLRPNAHGND